MQLTQNLFTSQLPGVNKIVRTLSCIKTFYPFYLNYIMIDSSLQT